MVSAAPTLAKPNPRNKPNPVQRGSNKTNPISTKSVGISRLGIDRCPFYGFRCEKDQIKPISHKSLLFNQHGDCLAAKLRPGNVSSAEDWDELLLPQF